VLLTLAIIAAAVVLRMQTPLRHAQMTDVMDAVSAFDRIARDAACQQDRPLRIVMYPGAGKIKLADDRGHLLPVAPLTMPDGFKIVRVLVRNQDYGGRDIAICCSPLGHSPTYALEISSGVARQWVVVAGLTGQTTSITNEDEARNILAATGEGLYAD
jgi:hypothetical protein